MRSFLMFLYFSFLTCSIQAQWDFHKQYNETAIYKSKRGSRLIVEKKDTLKKEKSFNKEFIKKIESKKKRMLEIIGIKNWKVDSREIKKPNKDDTHLSFSGSYMDNKGKTIFFHESHLYRPAKKIQFLITNPIQENLKRDMEKNSLTPIKKKYDL